MRSTDASTGKTSTQTGTGSITASGGKQTASSFTIGSSKQITVAGKTYLQGPGITSPKPWVLATTNSTNATVRALAASAKATAQAGTGGAAAYVSAASSIVLAGTQSLDGVTVGKYVVTVSVAKLPVTSAQRTALKAAGISAFTITQYVDAQGRTHEVQQTFSVAGTTTTSLYRINDFNQPVTITAPPASEVSAG